MEPRHRIIQLHQRPLAVFSFSLLLLRAASGVKHCETLADHIIIKLVG